MSHRIGSKIFLLFFTLVSSKIFAADLSSQVESFRLSNGMPWLLIYRPNVPVFSGLVMVRAGGINEVEGKTGLAHMFEHMAFKGSTQIGTRNFSKEIPILKAIAAAGRLLSEEYAKEKPDPARIADFKKQIHALTQKEYQHIIPNAVWATLSLNGAVDLNAFTSKDVTAYHASMPVAAFPIWARVSAEMVLNPVLREFYQERDVVMEERRLRYDNNPNGFFMEEMIATAYPQGPYHSAPIGHAKDLQQLTMEDALQFHKKYYSPRNMVGVLVGAISRDQAQTILNNYFSRYSGGPAPPDPKLFSFAFQGEKRKRIAYPAEPYFAMAFYKPRAPAREDYVFDMLDSLLCEGRTSRLNKRLVKELKLVSDISCSASFPGSRQDNLFAVFASPLNGVSLKKVEEALTVELKKIGEDLQESELEKVRKSVLHQYLWNLEGNSNLAEQLALAQTVLGGWRYVATYTQVIETISREEIQAIAKKYFVPENRVVIYRVKGKS